MKYKLTILCFILLIGSAYSIDDNAGTSGFSFLKVRYSARASAMANAFTGLADDATAVFYNPSGLSSIKKQEVQASYMNYLDGMNCGSLVYVRPLKAKFTVAGFAQFLTAKETRTLADASGNYIGNSGEFGVSNIILGLSVGRNINKILNLGISIKYIRESLDENVGSAIAFDIALLHQTTNKNLKIGIAYKNLGSQLEYYTDSKYEEKLPQVLTIGFNYHPQDKLYLLLDINKPVDLDFAGNLGVEYRIHEQLFLRGGYKTNAGDWRTGGDYDLLSGISLGLGLLIRSYKIDYSINSYGDLGFVNQLSLGYSF